jgi:hypothetical protein
VSIDAATIRERRPAECEKAGTTVRDTQFHHSVHLYVGDSKFVRYNSLGTMTAATLPTLIFPVPVQTAVASSNKDVRNGLRLRCAQSQVTSALSLRESVGLRGGISDLRRRNVPCASEMLRKPWDEFSALSLDKTLVSGSTSDLRMSGCSLCQRDATKILR